jgi:hypothetical protein
MAGMLMTVELEPGAADLDGAARSLGVAPSELDADFGVVPIAPEENLYSVMVDAASVPAAEPGAEYRGPYSNPRIEPQGPPR